LQKLQRDLCKLSVISGQHVVLPEGNLGKGKVMDQHLADYRSFAAAGPWI